MVPAASAAATAAEDAKEVLQAARCFLEAASARAECACRSRRACRCPSSLAGDAAPLCCATRCTRIYVRHAREGRGIPTVCVWSPKARCALRLWYTSTEGARSRFVRVYSQFSQCVRIRVNTVRHGRAAPRVSPRVSPRGAAVRSRRLRLRAPRRRRWRCLGLQRKRACALHSCRARSQRIGVDPGMPRGRCNAQPTR